MKPLLIKHDWLLAYALLGMLYFKIRDNQHAGDLACFGWQCLAVRMKVDPQ